MKQQQKKKKKTIFNIKPIGYDINYEYLCPKCGLNHWLTDTETKTNKFKIACDCGIIIIPAKITKIKFGYKKYNITKKSRKPKQETKQNQETTETTKKTVSDQTLNKVSSLLQDYGFEQKEARELACKAFDDIQIDDVMELLKQALKSFGVNNASFVETN